MKNPNDYIIDLAEKLFISEMNRLIGVNDQKCKNLARSCRRKAEIFTKEIEFYFEGRSKK